MKHLIILGAVWALVVARPEHYKEKEDFQYSRSSSDDGSKSGYYGAQRGNMGGNYEHAHNMDSLAQNQMSGLVRQVEGELGDGAKTRAGSVYTAANSRGTYGSGHFDLSNLEGRNFQEGTFYDDSQSRASQSSSSAYSAAGYNNRRSQNSRRSEYQAAGTSGLNVASDDLQSLDNLQGTGRYDYGRQSSHSSGYNAQSGYQQHSEFDTNNENAHYGGYGSNTHTRLISATPVRIIVRPGTRVAIPVAAQTYDTVHGSSLVDQNSINSDAEILNNNNQRTVYRPGNAKHYESSYNYRKEWEKHDTAPAAVTLLPTYPTENPFPKNSELYEDSHRYDATRADSQVAQSSNTYGGYRSSSRHDTQQHGASLHSNANAYTLAGHNTAVNHHAASSDSSLSDNIQSQYNAGSRYHVAGADSSSLTQAGYNTGSNANLNSQVENLNAKPKSYQSSYAYHKSWEHQGDPYVIKPASSAYYDGESTQRLSTGSTKNQAYAATGSHYQHSHQNGEECDESGHIRVARSYNADQYRDMQQQSQNFEDVGQQVQELNQWGQQNVGQQSQNTWDRLEDLSQQSHNQWDANQKNWDRLEELGQSADNTWGQKSQRSQDLEQKSQNDLGQHVQDIGVQVGHEPDVVQQTQDKLDFSNIGQQGQEIFQNQDYHYAQSHKFNSQENQHELKEFNYSHQSNRHNNNEQDQISILNQGVVNLGIGQNTQKSTSQSDKPSQFGSQNNDDSFLQQLTSNTQQTYKISNPNDQSNTYFSSDNSYLNVLPINENSFQIPDELYINNNENIYSNQNQNSTNSNSFSNTNTFQRIPPNTSPLFGLWNKLDNIEQQSTLSDNVKIDKGNDFSQVYATQNSYHNSRQERTNDTDTFAQQHYNQIKPNPEYHLQVNREEISQNNLNYSQSNKENAQDLGRGDIGPEDISDVVVDKKPYSLDTSVTAKETQNIGNTPEKEPFHPSLLSVWDLTSENSQVQKKIDYNISNVNHTDSQNIGIYHKNTGFINSPTQLQQQDQNFQQQSSFNIQEIQQNNMQNFNEANSTQQYKLPNYDPQDNIEQQNFEDFGHNENLEQHNLQDFGQQTNLKHFEQQENLEQQNLQNFGEREINLEQQNFGQQETLDQENIQDFGQQENLDQQNLQDFGQHDTLEQTLQNFGQPENVDQQNLQNFEQHENIGQQDVKDLGQHENLEQTLHNFGEPENLDQQNFEQHDNLEQQDIKHFGQQENLKVRSTLQNFRQPENLDQQNLQNFEQHENLGQQDLKDFEQQENLEKSLQNFGQPENLDQQNLQNFEQHENFGQQDLKDFEQQENFEKTLQNFRQPENLDQQNLQNFEQHENLGQQDLNDFEQQENLEKTLQNFRQPENLDQQNLQNFEQHENLGQQDLKDFEQQANLEQTLQNFGQPDNENLDQQNLQNFEQHENLEQQNLQDFGQGNLEQLNLQGFGQQEILEQQNMQDVQLQKNLEHYTNTQAFEQNGEKFDKQNPLNSELLIQSSKPNFRYTDIQKPQMYSNNNLKPQINLPDQEEVEESVQVQKQNTDLHSVPVQSQNTVNVLREVATEKPGFWKSVGNKFSSAKSKIASWFQS